MYCKFVCFLVKLVDVHVSSSIEYVNTLGGSLRHLSQSSVNTVTQDENRINSSSIVGTGMIISFHFTSHV